MSRRLPLFPIQVVLFPGARLPLHIFEGRYRQLLADVLSGDQCFGLVPPGADAEQAPPGALGTVARVVAHQLLPDGRSNIMLEGESRFILRRWLDEGTPYGSGLVDEFSDEEGASDLPGDALETLRRLAERCRLAMAALTDEPSTGAWANDAATLTFQVAAALPWAGDQARRLLALRTGAQRADVLLSVLPQLVPDLERRASVHTHSSTNGKGHHPPDLRETT
jgi:Lon protease-like protein